MTLGEYAPVSRLAGPRHPVRRARFPFVDVHGHQNLSAHDTVLRSLVAT
ncbi:MAG: hypothetical protein JWL60_90, partial [Gemmatimonadetes bacterium]|nr:hypothetical protein [Gemmatimonadota bacterium]